MTNLLHVMLSARPVNDVKSIEVPNIELLSQIDIINHIRSPRIIQTHLRFERLPTEHMANGGKIILTLRNPKDVIVSMFHHSIRDVGINSKLSWEYFLKYNMTGEMIMGSYFDYLIHWDHVIRSNTELNILVVYYEHLIKNPFNSVRQIRDFLGLKMDDVKLRDVIARCSLEKLKDDATSGRTKLKSVGEDKKPIIYRKGVIGDWMKHFTVAQNAEIDDLIRDKLSDTMFKFDYYPTTSESKL